MQNADILTTKQNMMCRDVFGEDAVWAAEADDTSVNVGYIDSVDTIVPLTTSKAILRSAGTVETQGYLYIDPIASGDLKYTVIDLSSVDFLGTDTSNCVYDASTGSHITSATDAEKVNPLIKIRIRCNSSTKEQRFFIYGGKCDAGLEHFDDAIFAIEVATSATTAVPCAYLMKGAIFDLKWSGTKGTISVVRPFTLMTKKRKCEYGKLYRCGILECGRPTRTDMWHRFMPGQKVFFSETTHTSYDSSLGVFDYRYPSESVTKSNHYAIFQVFTTIYESVANPYIDITEITYGSNGTPVPIDPSVHSYGDDYYLGQSNNSESVMVPPTIMGNVLYTVERIAQQRNRTQGSAYTNNVSISYYLKPSVRICQDS